MKEMHICERYLCVVLCALSKYEDDIIQHISVKTIQQITWNCNFDRAISYF